MNCTSALLPTLTNLQHLTRLDYILESNDHTDNTNFNLLTNLKRLQVTTMKARDDSMLLLTQLEQLRFVGSSISKNVSQLSQFRNLTRLVLGASSPRIELTCELPQVKYLGIRFTTKEEVEKILKKFQNLVALELEGAFHLPPNAERLTRLETRHTRKHYNRGFHELIKDHKFRVFTDA